MLDTVKAWLNRRRYSHPGEGELPHPKPLRDQPLDQVRLVVLDLETTGLNPAKDQVIAIGAVVIHRNAIDLRDQFDLILRRPELDITETVLIHGIGPEALTEGHETEDALVHLLEWLDGDPILAYHAAFDKKFLEKAVRQRLGYAMSHRWLDVAELLPLFFPNAETGGRGLDHWSEYFGLQASTRHHAAADAMVTAELTLIAINQALKEGITTLAELDEKLHHWRKLNSLKPY